MEGVSYSRLNPCVPCARQEGNALNVSLFIPCIVEQFHPQVGEATARILARAGASLDYPKDQTCCGQPRYKSGNWKSARGVARHFIEVFEEAEVVVAPSGSCVNMVRNYYPELLRDKAQWYRPMRGARETGV